jgi:hypothetical protein
MSDSIDQAIEALAQLRELVQEAHGAVKDLRAAIREAKQTTSGLPAAVTERMDREVNRVLGKYDVAITSAIKTAERNVSIRFDTLGAIFLGEDPESISEGKETLEHMIERVGKKHGR